MRLPGIPAAGRSGRSELDSARGQQAEPSNVQLVGLVVGPCPAMFSVRVSPGPMAVSSCEGVMVKVLPDIWNWSGQTQRIVSFGSTATNCQPLTDFLPLLTMVNWPVKPSCQVWPRV
jgi:hypothetical protein